ncbi:hypothetical protein J4458_00810 [Candidatus Woesearchaeota archaeon]|nr:hypothetical protein [Candidatus Woesearchaeota archaeon]
MEYNTLVEKIEGILNSYVRNSQRIVNEFRRESSIPGIWRAMYPNVYIAKGIREAVMFAVNPSGRIEKWAKYYKNTGKK